MERIELVAEPRELTRKGVGRVRAQGYVPAVLYGSKTETTSIQIEGKSLQKVLAKAGGNTLISIQIGRKKPVLALAREIQRDIFRHNILHVDFYQVVMTEKITAEVPLVFTGEAPAVKDLGGILVQGMETVEVQCLPGDLPSSIEVDLGSLAEFNDMLAVSSLQVPAAVTIVSDSDTVVARIEAPRMVEEEEVVEEEVEGLVEPEVVGRVAEEEAEAE